MSDKSITQNRKARFNYEITEKFEGGLVLQGSEVKSLRDGRTHLSDSYAVVRNDEVWLLQAHIAKYPAANIFNHEELRPRKVLMHKKEINYLISKVQEKGLTLIPLSLYFKGGRVKVELGLGRGKKLFDKREAIKDREVKRETQRVLKLNR